MSRWITTLLALIVGIALGLVYGWVIDPVKYVDTTPNTLRADYRADYVLSVAEAYQAEQNPESAARRLAILGSEEPGEIAKAALQTARQYGFAESDIVLIQKLTTAMQAWQPASGSVQP
jgi:hypothetical protein